MADNNDALEFFGSNHSFGKTGGVNTQTPVQEPPVTQEQTPVQQTPPVEQKPVGQNPPVEQKPVEQDPPVSQDPVKEGDEGVQETPEFVDGDIQYDIPGVEPPKVETQAQTPDQKQTPVFAQLGEKLGVSGDQETIFKAIEDLKARAEGNLLPGLSPNLQSALKNGLITTDEILKGGLHETSFVNDLRDQDMVDVYAQERYKEIYGTTDQEAKEAIETRGDGYKRSLAEAYATEKDRQRQQFANELSERVQNQAKLNEQERLDADRDYKEFVKQVNTVLSNPVEVDGYQANDNDKAALNYFLSNPNEIQNLIFGKGENASIENAAKNLLKIIRFGSITSQYRTEGANAAKRKIQENARHLTPKNNASLPPGAQQQQNGQGGFLSNLREIKIYQ